MKKLLFFLTTIAIVGNSYSQQTDNDTIIFKVVKSSWSIKFESGALMNQRQSQFDYIGNNVTQVTVVTIYYKNYFFYYDAYDFNITPKNIVELNGISFNNNVKFNYFTLNIGLGYNYDFFKNWGADIKLGLHTASFETLNYKDVGQYYRSDMVTGTRLGLALNRYFKLKRFNYIVISLAANYYSTNYKTISPNLDDSFMSYSLTVGYKGWFKKLIK